MLSPIHGPTWGYRTRARLSVRNVPKKGGVLVGFHERRSSFVADMHTCEVLPPRVAANRAAELGVEAHRKELVLDRVLRAHLADMAEVKLEFR